LRALARGRHGHGRHGHDRVPHDPGRHRHHGAGERAVDGNRVRLRVRDVGGDDGRHDDALGGADDAHVRARGPTGKAEGKVFAPTGWFAAGYFLVWVAFSLAATLAQWAVERAALLDSRMATGSNVVAAAVLIAAGAYQWTPLKDVCLVQSQSPFGFLMRHGG